MRKSGITGGNASVPVDAPIQGSQQFVDNARALFRGESLSGKGLTHLDGLAFFDGMFVQFALGGTLDGDASNNELPQANIDEILHTFVQQGNPDGTLDISGPLMASPTGGLANADLVTLGGANWTGFVSIGGVKTAFP